MVPGPTSEPCGRNPPQAVAETARAPHPLLPGSRMRLPGGYRLRAPLDPDFYHPSTVPLRTPPGMTGTRSGRRCIRAARVGCSRMAPESTGTMCNRYMRLENR